MAEAEAGGGACGIGYEVMGAGTLIPARCFSHCGKTDSDSNNEVGNESANAFSTSVCVFVYSCDLLFHPCLW